jgi:endothelin-converting enzyme/putative endopeptidase
MSRRVLLFLVTVLITSAFTIAQDQAQPNHLPVLDVSSMDTSVDPCVDFFAYSCNGWIKKNPIPPDQSSWGAYSKVQDSNRQQLRSLVESAASETGERAIYRQKIGDYYASCIDEKTIDAQGTRPLQEALAKIDGIRSKNDLSDVVAGMADQFALFNFRSDQDAKNSNEVIAEADQGGLGLPDRDYYFKDDPKSVDLRKAYLAHVQKMLELLGHPTATASAEAKRIMELETELARASMTRVERRDPKSLYHRMSADELQKLSPSFQWNLFFTKVGVPQLKSLNVETPAFFQAMSQLIEKQDLSVWKPYLQWHLVHANARFLSSPFLNEDFNFYGKTLTGREQLQPRWKRCTVDVDNDLGEALGQAYVEKYFSPDAKRQVLTMVTEIETAMQQDIDNLPWMSPETKKNALEKLHAVVNKIGYPEKWRDYSSLDIKRGDELGNVQRAAKFEFDRQLAKIGKPVDHQEWTMTPPTVNAYYDPQKNDVNFPAGILQPPLFDPRSDAAPNYGNTGGTIGHELTHGFDDEGRQFDATGNLRDWWTEADGKEFEKRASCISDQYSQYVIVDDIKINGKLTLGEDVADLGGLILAYMAWKQDTKSQNLQPIESFTPDQRFFIGYAQSWCGSTRDEAKRMRATVDEHSPDKYRANGVVTNMPEFQSAFHCKTGAPLAPAQRCRVW